MAAAMDSTSPECSDGNEASSAPSEFLAEFLSAIMRRQYAEALKYCRLILQYEPHNATARGFYPLLQHKIQKHKTSKEESCSSDGKSPLRDLPKKDEPREEVMEQEADESGSESGASCASCGPERSPHSRSRSEEASCASQSSLEMDSSPSVSLSRRTDPTDPTEPTDRTDPTDSTSGGCWESSASRSEPDDNGNAPTGAPNNTAPGDVENDNTGGGGCGAEGPRGTRASTASAHVKADPAGASLRRLRAQFACSIK